MHYIPTSYTYCQNESAVRTAAAAAVRTGHQEEMEFYHNYCMNHSKFVLAAGRLWMRGGAL